MDEYDEEYKGTREAGVMAYSMESSTWTCWLCNTLMHIVLCNTLMHMLLCNTLMHILLCDTLSLTLSTAWRSRVTFER